MDRKQPLQLSAQPQRAISLVSGEQLVASVTRERHRDLVASQFRQVPGWNSGRIAERFVVVPDEIVDDIHAARHHLESSVFGSQVLSNFRSVGRFIKVRHREANAERSNRTARFGPAQSP